MSFASANRTELYRVKESTWGVTPATPVLIECRYTGEAIDNNITTEKSNEIRSDRMVSDLVLVDSSPNGSVNIEMSYGSFHDLIESALMSSWSADLAIVGVAGDISTVVAATDNLTSTTGSKFAAVEIGQWIKLSGFTAGSGENNGYYQVTGKTDAQTLTVEPQPASAETPALAEANINGQTIKNGVVEQSYSLVKIFQDATTPTRQVFAGMRVKTMSLDMQTASLLTGAFGFTGKQGLWTESTFAGETFQAAPTTEVMNAVTNLQNLIQDGAVPGSPGSVMSLSLELDNAHREQKGIGVLGNVGVSAGRLMVNCNASQYFESKDQADKFENSTAFSFSFRLQDNAGNAYVVTLPRAKYETFVVNSSQLDSDVSADTTFTALRDPVSVCMIRIDRFDV